MFPFSIADAFLETKFFTRFTNKVHMLLNGNTLANLSVNFVYVSVGVKLTPA